MRISYNMESDREHEAMRRKVFLGELSKFFRKNRVIYVYTNQRNLILAFIYASK